MSTSFGMGRPCDWMIFMPFVTQFCGGGASENCSQMFWYFLKNWNAYIWGVRWWYQWCSQTCWWWGTGVSSNFGKGHAKAPILNIHVQFKLLIQCGRHTPDFSTHMCIFWIDSQTQCWIADGFRTYSNSRKVILKLSIRMAPHSWTCLSWKTYIKKTLYIYRYVKIVIYIYICLDMSQNEVSDFGSKMATLRGNVDTLFWDIPIHIYIY
jgi:hypothetical protein